MAQTLYVRFRTSLDVMMVCCCGGLMHSFTKFVTLFSIPLMVMNLLGGIVSFVWLVFLGEWTVVGYGIVGLIISSTCISLAMTPGTLLSVSATTLKEKKNESGSRLFSFLSGLYGVTVFSLWCLGVLFLFSKLINADSFIPVLLWSYVIATAPIATMAKTEKNRNYYITAFFAQMAYVVVIAMIVISKVSLLDVSIVFAFVMSIGLVVQSMVANQLDRQNTP